MSITTKLFILVAALAVSTTNASAQTPRYNSFVADAGDPSKITGLMIADIEKFSKEEREAAAQIALDCELPVDTDLYLQTTIDSIQRPCDKALKFYAIEFGLEKGKPGYREIDNQIDQLRYVFYGLYTYVVLASQTATHAHLASSARENSVKEIDAHGKAVKQLLDQIGKVNSFDDILIYALAHARLSRNQQ